MTAKELVCRLIIDELVTWQMPVRVIVVDTIVSTQF
jgi:hypothetical protein